jgi:hypothetical protein
MVGGDQGPFVFGMPFLPSAPSSLFPFRFTLFCVGMLRAWGLRRVIRPPCQAGIPAAAA